MSKKQQTKAVPHTLSIVSHVYNNIYKGAFLSYFMPATRYMRLKDMLRIYMRKNGTRITLARLRKEIIKNIGASEYRVVRSSLALMVEVNLLKDCGAYFEIDKREVLR